MSSIMSTTDFDTLFKVYASLSTLRTIDIKELIAYSSVSHAAVYLLGVFSNSIQGIEGAITLGIAHGFVSPGLFICAGGVLYDRSHTRVISFYRGVTQLVLLLFLLLHIEGNGATDNTGDTGNGATDNTRTTTTYRNMVLNTGKAEFDECPNNPDTDEHRIGRIGPDTFEYSPSVALTGNCDGCDKSLAYLHDTYSECIRCGKA
nr:NADH dehydrogenase subunit 4, mitochondrial [Tanacetum cinerariifolium]